jgi:hypothetical protein
MKTRTLKSGAATPAAVRTVPTQRSGVGGRLMVARRAEATSIGNGLTSRTFGFAGARKGDMAPVFAASESELPGLSPLCIVIA